MIKTSDAYKAAVVSETRRIRVLVPIRIQDPDLQFDDVTAGSSTPVSRPEQIHDDFLEASDNYATLEPGRWRLDSTMDTLEDDYSFSGQVGYVSGEICGADGTFATLQSVTLGISGVSTLQSCYVFFPGGELDGVAEDFSVSIMQGGTAYHTEIFSGNTAAKIIVSGFTVYAPDAIRVTVTKWSIPYRRMRVMEIYPGYAETWTEEDLSALYIKMQAAINAMATPYGTASITLDNTDRLFDPRNKVGLFASLEERQPVPIKLGVDLPDGSMEWLPCGVFYQHNGAWATSNDGMTMRWDLVDIVGLLADRTFIAPDTLPTNLEDWAAELVSQLGDAFVGHYTVDQDYRAKTVTADAAAVNGKNCGDILRWLCQKAGVFARADSETGYLALEPLWSQGNEYTLDNLQQIPTISANDNLAGIIFKMNADTNYIVSGNLSTSANTVTVENPFLSGQADALNTARNILTSYGGNKVSTTGRGDPSSEIGDVVTIQIDKSNAIAARLTSQTFEFSDGVLTSCKSDFLQSDGALLYTNREVITTDCTWTAPEGVTSLNLILVGGGQGGGRGRYNWESSPGPGDNGSGGMIWYGKIQINDRQSFSVHIGAGGAAEKVYKTPVDGEPTTFGIYSSDDGRVYSPSFTDIISGSVFGRTGVNKPTSNTGDGGAGGANRIGSDGASGCVVIYWDKEENT